MEGAACWWLAWGVRRYSERYLYLFIAFSCTAPLTNKLSWVEVGGGGAHSPPPRKPLSVFIDGSCKLPLSVLKFFFLKKNFTNRINLCCEVGNKYCSVPQLIFGRKSEQKTTLKTLFDSLSLVLGCF